MEEKSFDWSERWQLKDSPWHKDQVNGFLIKHFEQLSIVGENASLRIFVPLCGNKTQLYLSISIIVHFV